MLANLVGAFDLPVEFCRPPHSSAGERVLWVSSEARQIAPADRAEPANGHCMGELLRSSMAAEITLSNKVRAPILCSQRRRRRKWPTAQGSPSNSKCNPLQLEIFLPFASRSNVEACSRYSVGNFMATSPLRKMHLPQNPRRLRFYDPVLILQTLVVVTAACGWHNRRLGASGRAALVSRLS
jgi:hypothetical protein